MAKMIPATIPPDIKMNELRAAEIRVYEKLEDSLGKKFVVFYSRPWIGSTPDGREVDGECDFLIAHPDKGILTVEVKGGGISFSPQTDVWKSVDRYGCRHTIKNPVEQAKRSKHEILNKLRVSREWNARYIRARHAVIFPDSSRPSSDLGAAMPRRIFCFSEQFDDLAGWVDARMSNDVDADAERPLGEDGIRALHKLLAKPIHLSVPLSAIVREDVRVQDVLTADQFHILSAMEEMPRAAVAGGAGTGKTILAMEKFQRCLDAGTNAIFICYNRTLATWLRSTYVDIDESRIVTFHALCRRMATEAGLDLPTLGDEREIFEQRYPELLMEAAFERPDLQVEAVIVDEGQDFAAHWWAAVDAVLTQGNGAQLYVFYDSNQLVYGQAVSIPQDATLIPIRLRQNLRNTKAIHKAATAFYDGFHISSAGPEGRELEWVRVPKGGVADAVSEQVNRIARNERLRPEQIAVLAATQKDCGKLVDGGGIAGFPVRSAEENSEGCVIVDTVRRFKGLESAIVILVVDHGLMNRVELLYVGLSRARSQLVLVGEEPYVAEVQRLCGATSNA